MIIENIRDKKVLELYTALTRSDFKGYINDDYVIRLLYGTLCFESALHERKLLMDKNRILDFAKEIIRIYDEKLYDETDNYSIEVLTRLMLEYTDKEKKTYNDVHKMNTRELKQAVCKHKASEN